MRYLALATDYDGTVATSGKIQNNTLSALKLFRASGRKLILVTGRILSELKQVCPEYKIFDWIVVENGASIFQPGTQQETLLGNPLSHEIAIKLRVEIEKMNIPVFSMGRVMIATVKPFDSFIDSWLQRENLGLQKIFNKESVMYLPPGINKFSGLEIVLKKLSLSYTETVGVGDAENDLPFLTQCGFSISVLNALPQVKTATDWTTSSPAGEGVSELVGRLLGPEFHIELSHTATRQLGQDGRSESS